MRRPRPNLDPPDGDDACPVCHSEENPCLCRRCPVCGLHGDPRCYRELSPGDHHGRVLTAEQWANRFAFDAWVATMDRWIEETVATTGAAAEALDRTSVAFAQVASGLDAIRSKP